MPSRPDFSLLSVIRLFISDIDGCLAEPFQPYDLTALTQLAALSRSGEPTHPALSLLSGRAFPYVEAMSQVLGTHVPVAFESGGGVFDRLAARVTWNPLFTAEVAEQIAEIRQWIHRDLLPGTPLQFDYGKRTQAGVIGSDEQAVRRAAERIKRHVADHHVDLVAFETSVSVDVMARQITKEQAVMWLSDLTGVAASEMAYVGDSEGDLEALGVVGFSFCPANSHRAVLQAVHTATQGSHAEGVLEAYRWCVVQNERAVLK